jgi:hypothetical protein
MKVEIKIAGTWREPRQPNFIKKIEAKKQLEKLFEKKEEDK